MSDGWDWEKTVNNVIDKVANYETAKVEADIQESARSANAVVNNEEKTEAPVPTPAPVSMNPFGGPNGPLIAAGAVAVLVAVLVLK